MGSGADATKRSNRKLENIFEADYDHLFEKFYRKLKKKLRFLFDEIRREFVFAIPNGQNYNFTAKTCKIKPKKKSLSTENIGASSD